MYHQDWCFLAVQGPQSVHVMERLFPASGDLAFMQCVEAEYKRRPVIVTRSGYTGEVGFELFTYQDVAQELWSALMRGHGAVRRHAVRSGGARRAPPGDGLPACTARTCSSPSRRSRPVWGGRSASTRGSSEGDESLLRQQEEGLPSRLLGLRMQERRHIPRAALPGVRRRPLVGEVTSGTFSPLLGTGIALAYLWPADVVSRWATRSRSTSAAGGARPRSCARRSSIAILAERRPGLSQTPARGGRRSS